MNCPAGVSTEPLRETQLAEAFIVLADRLVAQFDLVELLHYLVEISVELLDVAAAGLVLADGAGQLNVMASTSSPVELLESLQITYRLPARASSVTPPVRCSRSLM